MVKLHNTLSGKKEELVSKKDNRITMYVCGVTPYDNMHLGHARTYIAFDIMRRYLTNRGFDVYFVQNVTDVDDKILKRAKEVGEEPLALSAKFDAASRKDMTALGILPADVYPKVSEHISEIEALVEKIIKNKAAYTNESGVYFEVGAHSGYGQLSRQKLDEIKAGARVEVDEKKKNPMDFALWKTAKPGELAFDSKFGKGRPGWHIECSAMSMKYIGDTIDIHGGARDLIFPHHENERAQSEAVSGGEKAGKPFVRCWCHTGFLTVNGEKMAKSLGNFVTVQDMLKKHDANAIRLFFASTHYRSPIDFSETALAQAETNVNKIFNTIAIAESALRRGKKDQASQKAGKMLADASEFVWKRFISAMDDDLDTPQAVAALFEIIHAMNAYCGDGGADSAVLEPAVSKLREMLSIFGIAERKIGESDEKKIEQLVSEREEARKRKDYATSDAIRKKLLGMGIALEDGKDGRVVWKLIQK